MNPTAPSGDDGPSSDLLPVGTRVEVRNGFDGTWSRGFTVSGDDGGRYRIRRRTDGAELPGTFDVVDVRRERTRSTWWI